MPRFNRPLNMRLATQLWISLALLAGILLLSCLLALLYLDRAGDSLVALLRFDQPRPEAAYLGLLAVMLAAGLAIAAFAAFTVRTRIVRPIEQLVRGAKALQEGELGHRIQIARSDELSELGHAMNAMAENLEREKEFLSAVVDNIDAGIVACDADGKLSFFNRATEKLHGLPREKLPPERWAEHYDLRKADGSPMGKDEIPLFRACRGERVRNVEMVVAPKGRDPRTLLASGRALVSSTGERLGAVVAMTDITDRKNRETEMASSAAREAAREEAEAGRGRMTFLAEASEVLASSMNYEKTLGELTRLCVPFLADWCAIDMLDEKGELRRVEVAHRDPERLELARELYERYPPDRDAAQGAWAVVRSGSPQVLYEITDSDLTRGARDAGHLEIMRALGLRSAMSLPIEARGRSIGALTLVTSDSGRTYGSTELDLATDLVRRASAAVERALLFRELEEANRVKDDFLATLSHELRTPLTAILGWSRMLRTMELDPAETTEAIATIERSAVAQAQLIEDVLDVSRITTGKMNLNLRKAKLTAIIQDAIATVRPAAQARQIRIDEDLADGPGELSVDPDRIQQVLWNLLMNAIKFSPKGSAVGVSIHRAHSDAVIEVRDQGAGISASFLPYVFEPFRQADSSTRRSQAGLGLGLAIVRRLVELHGGSVSVASEGEGKGSVFTIRLPISPAGSKML